MLYKRRTSSGYVLLLGVLILGIAGSIVAVTVSLLGTDMTRQKIMKHEEVSALYVAEGCIEQALERLRQDNNYSGENNVIIGEGTCSVSVTNTGGSTREIIATGYVRDAEHSIEVQVNALRPTLEVSSWQDIFTP